jgi:hypothetical protein
MMTMYESSSVFARSIPSEDVARGCIISLLSLFGLAEWYKLGDRPAHRLNDPTKPHKSCRFLFHLHNTFIPHFCISFNQKRFT